MCDDEYVRQYLESCLAIESPPRVSELAELAGLSPTQLTKGFHRRYGMSAAEYLKRWQIARAEELMRQTTLSTTVIAYRCGFGTRRTFFRAYRRIKGKTPAAFRALTAPAEFRSATRVDA